MAPQQQMWLPIPVVAAPSYIVIERLGLNQVRHGFQSLDDAVAFVSRYGRGHEIGRRELTELLLSGQEWSNTRRGMRGRMVTRHWRLTTETRR